MTDDSIRVLERPLYRIKKNWDTRTTKSPDPHRYVMLAGKKLPEKQKKAGKRQNITKEDGKFVVTTANGKSYTVLVLETVVDTFQSHLAMGKQMGWSEPIILEKFQREYSGVTKEDLRWLYQNLFFEELDAIWRNTKTSIFNPNIFPQIQSEFDVRVAQEKHFAHWFIDNEMAKQYAHEGPERVEIQNEHFVTVVWDGGKVFKRALIAKEAVQVFAAEMKKANKNKMSRAEFQDSFFNSFFGLQESDFSWLYNKLFPLVLQRTGPDSVKDINESKKPVAVLADLGRNADQGSAKKAGLDAREEESIQDNGPPRKIQVSGEKRDRAPVKPKDRVPEKVASAEAKTDAATKATNKSNSDNNGRDQASISAAVDDRDLSEIGAKEKALEKNSEKKVTIGLTGDSQNDDESALPSIDIHERANSKAHDDHLTPGSNSINDIKSLVAAANAEDDDEEGNLDDYWDLSKPNRFMKPRSLTPKYWRLPPLTNKYWDFSGRSGAYSKKMPFKQNPGFRTTKY